MGAGMARSLLRAGHEVTVWNRDPARARELAPAGAVPASTVAAAVTGAQAVVTMLFDAGATLSVKDELTAAMGPDAVWIQSATVGVDGIRELAQGVPRIVDAPVLGTRKPAEDGTLVVLASGDPSLLDRCRPVFEAVGSRTVVVGDMPGPASALKLVCNCWVALLNAGVAQSVQFARVLGLDPWLFLEAIDGTPTGAPYAQIKGAAMVSGDYAPSFAVDGIRKDLDLMVEAAGRTGLAPQLLTVTRDLYARASAAGLGDADIAAVVEAFTQPEASADGHGS
ncbi:NAD(P)-dependent oxidoreductase [Catellatospora coxensis]|uniref:3-hydroxyisobutyrate dehydrogenase n=2 Tax=Catellatospora coxensis TaxID=310354 RepID=A0A8J3KU23_9ACTN|nr:3-hydroxyisobutyrate dehydrogenase [Catellatospora coxensis]